MNFLPLRALKQGVYLPLLVGLVVILPALLVSSVLWYFLSAQINENYEKRLQTSLKIFDLVLENRRELIHESLLRLASDNTFRVTLELDIRPQLRRYVSSQFKLSETTFLLVAKPDGEVLASLGKFHLESTPLLNYAISGRSSTRQIKEFNGDLYLIESDPVFSGETILGFVCSGMLLTDQQFIKYLEEKMDAIPGFWWEGRSFIAMNGFSGTLSGDLTEGGMHDLEAGGTKFRGMLKTLIIGEQPLKIGVLISLEALKETIGHAVWFMAFVLLSITIIALFAVQMFFMRRRAEDEKKQLEEKLQQSLKMEALGTLAGGIAHDFNNILAAILGYAELAKLEVPENSASQDCLDEILKAGNRARDLVMQILSFSRKSHKELIPLSIYSLVNETMKLLRATIPTTIQIKQELYPQCGNILADPTQIHQIVMNICTNAAQAMEEEGGVLTVGLSCEEVSEEDLLEKWGVSPGNYVKLSIGDTGTGIEPGLLNLIFDPYFTTKEVGKGSGMGLAVVHGIVTSHKGMIEVESQPGQGTTFHVYFPQVVLEEKTEQGEPEPLSQGNERVLVVDDEQSIVELMQRRLEKLGYRVTTAVNSKEALELFRARPEAFDLVITDQTMPLLTGEQLAGELLGIRQDIPIILCTGYSAKLDETKAKALGIKALVMKPIDTKQLARVMRRVLE